MSITSLSFTFVNTYAPQSAKPATAAERPAPAATVEHKGCDEHRAPSRQNRLVEAMMSALRELGFGSQAAAMPATEATTASASAATSTAAATQTAAAQTSAAESPTNEAVATAATVADAAAEPAAAQAAAEPAVTVESAVHQFAHELFRALRQVARGEGSDEGGSSRIDGEGGRRHHHGHHGWRNQGYGDMSQRLDALSQTFAAQLPAAASEAQAPSAVSSSISITLTVQDGQADSADAPSSSALSSSTPVSTSSVAPVDAVSMLAETAPTASAVVEPAESAAPMVAAAAPAKNPLLEAFSKLFNALKPQAVAPTESDMAGKLRIFLQTLAQAMRPETMSTLQAPQMGGLVNVTA